MWRVLLLSVVTAGHGRYGFSWTLYSAPNPAVPTLPTRHTYHNHEKKTPDFTAQRLHLLFIY